MWAKIENNNVTRIEAQRGEGDWREVMPEVPPRSWCPALEYVVRTDVVEDDAVTPTFSVVRRPVSEQVAVVKAEAQRRIMALTGSTDLVTHQLRSDNMIARRAELACVVSGTMRDEAGDIMPSRNLTPEEDAEDRALAAVWRGIKRIRARSNAIEALDPIPADFADDKHW